MEQEQTLVQKPRIEYLDIARGMTILMIVSFHVLGETILVYHHFVDTMGLQVFLFVSGYFYKKFDLWKNIKKLVIPYMLLLTVVRVYWDVRLHSGFDTQVTDLLKQFVIGYTYDTMWQQNGFFVGIAWFFPLLVASRLLYVIVTRIEKENLLVKGCLCLGLSCAGVVIGSHGIKLPWSLDVAMASLPFVYLGELARNYQQVFTAMYRKIWLLAAFLVTWAVMVFQYGISELASRLYPNGMTFLIISSLSMFVVIGAAYFLEHYLPKLGKVFVIYGKYSFAVLCAHILDKSCLVHSPETNIYLLLLYELFLASIPVIVICLIRIVKKGISYANAQR